MAVVAHTYTKYGISAVEKFSDYVNNDIKVMLLSAYTVGTTQDSAQFLSDVVTIGTATEATGTGYTAGGQSLTTKTVSVGAANHVVTLSCANPSWPNSTLTAAYALFYDNTPATTTTKPVILYWDFGGNVSSTSGVFTLTISSSGLLTLTGS